MTEVVLNAGFTNIEPIEEIKKRGHAVVWGKFVALFKDSTTETKNTKRNTSSSQGNSQGRSKVDPSRIGELGEYKIEVQLRQLSGEYRYINDVLLTNPRSRTGYAQIDHVLITPYGLFVIETKNYKGSIRGKREEQYWRVNGKFSMYNPVRQNRTHINALQRILQDYKDVRFISVISFTKRCELYIDQDLREVGSDEIVVYDILLTEFIQRKINRMKSECSTPPLSQTDITAIFETLKGHNITDARARDEHVQKQQAMRKKTH